MNFSKGRINHRDTRQEEGFKPAKPNIGALPIDKLKKDKSSSKHVAEHKLL